MLGRRITKAIVLNIKMSQKRMTKTLKKQSQRRSKTNSRNRLEKISKKMIYQE